MAKESKNMAEMLRESGAALKSPPSSFDELYHLLDVTYGLLARVDQSSSQLMLDAIEPITKALLVKDFLRHSDMDVKVSVASCISEITRITAPTAPYEDDIMREMFRMIVGAFEGLDDMSSSSYRKRVSILETVANVRSCTVMLDLECDALILQIFQHFLKTIRVDHSENVFSAMETIMTLVIEESDDISSELLSCLLDTMKNDNKDVLPIATKLAEKVMTCCASKIKPYLLELIQSTGASLSEYSKVVASICQENSDDLDHNEMLAFGEAVEMASPPRSTSKAPNADEAHLGDSVRPKSRRKRALETKKELDERLVGSMIKVWWPKDKMFHECVIKSYDCHTKKHTVVYTDGDVEHLVLKNKRWASVEKDLKKANEMASSPRSASKAPNTADVHLGDSVGPRPKSRRKHALETKKEMASSPSASNALNPDEAHLGDSVRPKSRRERALETKTELDECLVGSMIKVWWPEDKIFYEGVVESFDCHSKKHTLVYTGGGMEHLVLKNELWESVENDLEKNKEMASSSRSASRAPIADESYLGDSVRPKSRRKCALETKKEMASSQRSASKAPNADEARLGDCVRPKSTRKRALETKKELDERLVGSTIKVWWPKDKMFYEGVVESYDCHSKKHMIVYTGGDVQNLVLKKEVWEYAENDLEKDKEMTLSPRSVSKAPNADEAHLGDSVRPKSRRKRALETKKELDESLVGSRIKVWWPDDEMFYECVVESYDYLTKKHKLLYTDGEMEHLVLKNERWEYVENDFVNDKGNEEGSASWGLLPHREIDDDAKFVGVEALDDMLEEAGRSIGIPGVEIEGFTRALKRCSQGQTELCRRYYHILRLCRDRVKSLEENATSLSDLVRRQGVELEEERTRVRQAVEEKERLKKEADQTARSHRTELWKAKARGDVLFEAGVKYVKNTFLELHPEHVDLISFLEENTVGAAVGTSAGAAGGAASVDAATARQDM